MSPRGRPTAAPPISAETEEPDLDDEDVPEEEEEGPQLEEEVEEQVNLDLLLRDDDLLDVNDPGVAIGEGEVEENPALPNAPALVPEQQWAEVPI